MLTPKIFNLHLRKMNDLNDPAITYLLSQSSVDFLCKDQYTFPHYLQRENKTGQFKPLMPTQPLPSHVHPPPLS